MLEYSVGEWYESEFCSKILVANPTKILSAQWVRKPESLLYKGHRYYGNEPVFEDPRVYSATWAECLALESQGPVYCEIALIRKKMAKGSMSVNVEKRYNLVCYNKFNASLAEHYLRSIAWSLKTTETRVRMYWEYLKRFASMDCCLGDLLLDIFDQEFDPRSE